MLTAILAVDLVSYSHKEAEDLSSSLDTNKVSGSGQRERERERERERGRDRERGRA